MNYLYGLLLVVLLACAPERIIPARQAPPADSLLAQGEKLFMQHCHQCHPSGAGGLGPSLNDKPIPAFAIRFQVRYGLGAMPAFPPSLVSDSQLGALVAYVQHLHAVSSGQP